jgi:TPR repeat protein
MRVVWLMAAALFVASPATAQSAKVGVDAWAQGDFAGAIAAWRPLAAKGNPDAMFNLGQAYRLGRGVPIDLAAAQGWYDRAAHGGHVDAQTQLGMLLFQTGNRAAGLRWLKAAADKGEARAQLLYGPALFNGDGIERDPPAAYRYVSKSAAQGLAPAKSTLAQLDEVMPVEMRRLALAGAAVAAAPPVASKKVGKGAITKAAPISVPALTMGTPPVTGGGWRVQLGAFSQRVGAEGLFRKLATGPLAGKQAYLVPVGAMTRLQAGPFASRAEASAACSSLAARGQACFVVAAK